MIPENPGCAQPVGPGPLCLLPHHLPSVPSATCSVCAFHFSLCMLPHGSVQPAKDVSKGWLVVLVRLVLMYFFVGGAFSLVHGHLCACLFLDENLSEVRQVQASAGVQSVLP